jgi:hypothetical protein
MQTPNSEKSDRQDEKGKFDQAGMQNIVFLFRNAMYAEASAATLEPWEPETGLRQKNAGSAS